MSAEEKYKEQAEADVASVQVGDNPTEVESKVLGRHRFFGGPSENAEGAEETSASLEGS
jgi:hypothetical protein